MALVLMVGPGEGLPWAVTCHPQDSFAAAAQGGQTLTHSGWGSWPVPSTGRWNAVNVYQIRRGPKSFPLWNGKGKRGHQVRFCGENRDFYFFCSPFVPLLSLADISTWILFLWGCTWISFATNHHTFRCLTLAWKYSTQSIPKINELSSMFLITSSLSLCSVLKTKQWIKTGM